MVRNLRACGRRALAVPGFHMALVLSAGCTEDPPPALSDAGGTDALIDAPDDNGSSSSCGLASAPNALALSLAGNHSCAVLSDGSVRCWGGNGYGAVGGAPPLDVIHPRIVEGLPCATAVASAGQHTCALLQDRTVTCWGSDTWGQLGNDLGGIPLGTPTAVSLLSNARTVESGRLASCVIHDDGGVSCWGTLRLGPKLTVPTVVPGLARIQRVAVGTHGCAVGLDGTVACWGDNEFGQLGDGTYEFRAEPVQVQGLSDIVDVRVGGSFTCALRDDGAVLCWGMNSDGQLGAGTVDANSPAPQLSLIPSPAIRLALGSSHACAEVQSGSLVCWGNNGHHQLGDGTVDDQPIPVAVEGVSDTTQVSLGAFHSCALFADGSIKCWGRGYEGQLGDGMPQEWSPPTTVVWD